MINLIIFGAFLGLSEGAGVLPDGPLNASVGGLVLFETTLKPTEEPFLSVSWSFGAERPIITSQLNINTTGPEYEDRIRLFRSTGYLELRNLNLNDDGEYIVNILPAVGLPLTGHIKLNIYEPVSVEIIPPSAKVAEFRSVSFFCSSTGSDLSFLWLHGSSEITASDRVQINTTNGGSYLTIVNVTRSDRGTYWCRGSNFVSSSNDSASLVVNYGPEETQLEVLPSQDYYDEGSTVTLMCSAESLPPAEFSWFHNGDALPDTGPEITLSQIQMSQNGSYTCRAFNSETLGHQTSQPQIINVKKNPNSSGMSAGAITGIVGGCLCVGAAGGGGGYYMYRKKKRNDSE